MKDEIRQLQFKQLPPFTYAIKQNRP